MQILAIIALFAKGGKMQNSLFDNTNSQENSINSQEKQDFKDENSTSSKANSQEKQDLKNEESINSQENQDLKDKNSTASKETSQANSQEKLNLQGTKDTNLQVKENSQENSTNSKARSMNSRKTSQATSQAKETSQSIHSLLDDLEARFGSLLAVRNLAILNKKELFDFLLKDSTFAAFYTKEFFDTSTIADKSILHFKQTEFLKMLDFRVLSGSFTAFASKIGLAQLDFKAKFIKADERVVLNFPFKDGVIKGAQSKDEDKGNEIFFNDILARDEIDVLFSPKALQGFELIGGNPSLMSENSQGKSPSLAEGI